MRERGREYEKLAFSYLKMKGYRIISRNFSTSSGEIDLIGYDKDKLCFIEVKERSFPYKYKPYEAVDTFKRKKLIRAAYAYIKKNRLKTSFRFDILSIERFSEGLEFYLLKNAFSLEG